MSCLPSPWLDYPDAPSLEDRWLDLARNSGARSSVVATSVEGRPIHRLDLGPADAPAVLLTGLVHGVELVGALALYDFIEQVAEGSFRDLLRHAHLVILPIVNPDALHANSARLSSGRRAFQRCNARGVDLNRNFPRQAAGLPLNPLGGSRWRFSPHYVGPHVLSEPESRALRDVADQVRPRASLGFHSFGELLLYPWAYTTEPNPRRASYERAGRAFLEQMPGRNYRVMQATDWYRTVGDLDDWLDAEFGTLAFTIEVSRPMRRLANLRRASNPFAWSNPVDLSPAVSGIAPGIDALLRAALEPEHALEHAP
jgi:predicted deacylase